MAYTLGIDVSKWQDNNSTPQKMDFVKAKNAGAEFVFIKASQRNWMDEDILYNWKSAKDAGLLRGAYHFLVWDLSPESQADFFAGLLKNDPGELPPVVDFEWWSTVPTNALDIMWRFIARLKNYSYLKEAMIYTAPAFWKEHGVVNSAWAKYNLWLANYDVKIPYVPLPWQHWEFWQFTSKGDGLKFGAESLDLDMDYFNGTKEELYKFAGITPAPYQINLPIILNGTPEERITALETDMKIVKTKLGI